jgi:hypothetical protein
MPCLEHAMWLQDNMVMPTISKPILSTTGMATGQNAAFYTSTPSTSYMGRKML